jgi:hypothetical protein
MGWAPALAADAGAPVSPATLHANRAQAMRLHLTIDADRTVP